MSAFSKNLLQYYTSQSSSEIYIQNMKNIHPSLNENNIYGLALLSVNPAIPEEERQIFKKCLELKGKEIQKQLATALPPQIFEFATASPPQIFELTELNESILHKADEE